MKQRVVSVLRLQIIAAFGLIVLGCTPKEATPVSVADASNRVVDGLKVRKPEGKGPFPTVVYFHSASNKSWYPAQETILDGFVNQGYATVFVDMYHGRGVGGQAVRSGSLLPRATAGDAFVAVDWVREQSWADQNKIGLFGISFGAATIMDTLVLSAPGKMPTSIQEKPAKGLSGVQGAALLSPWCAKDVMGFNLIKAVHEDFATQVPIIAIIPQADTVSDEDLCLDILNRNKTKGASIEAVLVEGAGHTFAQEKDDYGNRFPDYNLKKSKEAWGAIYSFFKKRLG
ncbi:MAG: hypothetical protein HN809_12405 [Rhodospirillaceae bacterium]|jgi:dienelactone hydrolase|nr:hypothetical protein [Rhodospirillaceae bacterium]